jgi:hypothetical protein
MSSLLDTMWQAVSDCMRYLVQSPTFWFWTAIVLWYVRTPPPKMCTPENAPPQPEFFYPKTADSNTPQKNVNSPASYWSLRIYYHGKKRKEENMRKLIVLQKAPSLCSTHCPLLQPLDVQIETNS